MRSVFWLAALSLVLSGAFAGCMGGAEPAAPVVNDTPEVEEPIVDDGTTEMSMDVGHAPHIHDYWQDKERITIMDQQVDIDAFTALRFTFVDVVSGTPGVGGVMVELPDGAIVYEGTGQLSFTATWSEPTMTGVGLRYRTPASTQFSEAQALQTDTPLVIDVTPEMCDMPHEKDSRWTFLLTPPNAGNTMFGKLHVKVDIVRMRDITMFPGHPELFAGANTLPLYDGPAKSSSQNFAAMMAGFVTQSNVDSSVVSEKVVPMETQSMTANVTITAATASIGQVNSVDFLFKTAATNRYQLAQVLSSDPATGVYQFGWPVEMAETDSPYADASQWHFDLWIHSQPVPGAPPFLSVADAQVDYNLQVVAYDALVEGVEPASEEDEN